MASEFGAGGAMGGCGASKIKPVDETANNFKAKNNVSPIMVNK